jgi:hypothetical protein
MTYELPYSEIEAYCTDFKDTANDYAPTIYVSADDSIVPDGIASADSLKNKFRLSLYSHLSL